jgi:hypothetical protein
LALPQRLFGDFLVIDIDAYRIPLDDLAVGAAQRYAMRGVPAILAISAPYTHFEPKRPSTLQ